MKRARPVFRTGLLLAALCGCAHHASVGASDEGRLVEAEGWTPLDAGKPLETRQRALAEAQKKAVEQVVGVTVSATTKVESAVTLEQKILANIGGHIQNYKILSERSEEGFLKIRIRALVLRQPPKPPASAAKGVRISVLCADESLAATLRAALSAQGFSVEPNSADADYIVKGNASAYALADSGFPGLRANRARVVLDLSGTKTKEAFQQVQEASALDPADEHSRQKAMAVAASLAAEGLAARLKAGLGIPQENAVSNKP